MFHPRSTQSGSGRERLIKAAHNVWKWSSAPQPHLRGRWWCLRIVSACFLAAFVAFKDQALGLVGSDGLSPVAERWRALQQALGGRGIDWILRCEGVAGVILAVLAFINIAPKAAFASATILWSACLYELGPFDVYQPDAILVSAGLCATLIAPPSLRPGLGARHPPTRIELLTVWALLFSVYWGSAVIKLQNPEWRSLTIMEHYWESAPVPAWTGWLVQTYLPHWAMMVLCALVILTEAAAPLLLFGGARSLRCFVLLNVTLQLGIALTASYSFLNLLMIGLGMLALRDSKPTDPVVDKNAVRWLPVRSVAAALYGLASLVTTSCHLVPVSFRPFRVRPPTAGPGHFVNTYGLYQEVGQTGYRVRLEGTKDGAVWFPYEYRCLPMDERARPQLVWPYQCRLDWFMWRVSRHGFIEDDGFIGAVLGGIARGSTQVASLFSGEWPRGRLSRIRVSIRQYTFATPEERRTGRWWTTRAVEVHEVDVSTPQGGQGATDVAAPSRI
jgi:hypothetical protein